MGQMVTRMKCQWCGSRKHAIQYQGYKLTRLSEATQEIETDHPGVCLVCPRCDSPAAVAPR